MFAANVFFRKPCLCCSKVEHCPNVKNPDQADSLLQKVDHLRALLKGELAKKGIMRHWVMAGWKDLLGVENHSRPEDIDSLSLQGLLFLLSGWSHVDMLYRSARLEELAAAPAQGQQGAAPQVQDSSPPHL
jgi:hypothetical protein